MLTSEVLLSAEIGSRLLLIRIHDLCCYARGEIPPHWLQLEESLETKDYSPHFVNSTFLPARVLNTAWDESLIAKFAGNVLDLNQEQELAKAISGELPPICYRDHNYYPTAFKAANSIALDLSQFYDGFGFCEFEWDAKSESERVADCIEFWQWVNLHLSPTFLWSVYQRIEQERIAYLAWCEKYGKPITYPAPNLSSVPDALCHDLRVNPHIILFGEAVFEREVNCWPKTQQRSEEQFAALRSSYGLSNPLNPSRFDAENDSATKATSKDRTKAEPDSATSLALRFYHIFLFLFDDIRSQEHCL